MVEFSRLHRSAGGGRQERPGCLRVRAFALSQVGLVVRLRPHDHLKAQIVDSSENCPRCFNVPILNAFK